ncbi:DUF6969 family protein [Devosia sp.]|uniref:DUF6969 family protein n=1 Tax=Devosia sp. TaxID=1871048 RepID=UPI002F1AA4EB
MSRDEDLAQAAREALFCEQVLAKSGDNVLLETLRGAASVDAWTHYPPGDVFDPASGAQWYYHCHAPARDAREHGHFHCFVRPAGKDGPVHHLVAAGVDPYGRLIRLFTVNQWVVDDAYLAAPELTALLPRFDVQMGRPSYLVNRWLTAVLALYRDDITALIAERDTTLGAGAGVAPAPGRLADRGLEVTSTRDVDLAERARALGL